jgi:16S rRNA (cytidine1402-2'-O)-methyltransferase
MSQIYFISNHIGNIKDLTQRAIDVLVESDIIYYEEEGPALFLLDSLKIYNKKIQPYPMFVKNNELDKDFLDAISDNKKIAFLPEYGNPVIADQGQSIMRLLSNSNINYDVLPGASIGSTALAISGIHDSDNFCVIDSIQIPLSKLHEQLLSIKDFQSTIVIIPDNKNVRGILQTIESALGNKKASLCMDLTMPKQEVIRSKVSNLIEFTEKTDVSQYLCTIVVSYNTR